MKRLRRSCGPGGRSRWSTTWLLASCEGAATHVHMRVGDHDLQAVVPNDGSALAAVEGGDVGLVLAADALRVLAD